MSLGTSIIPLGEEEMIGGGGRLLGMDDLSDSGTLATSAEYWSLHEIIQV